MSETELIGCSEIRSGEFLCQNVANCCASALFHPMLWVIPLQDGLIVRSNHRRLPVGLVKFDTASV